MAPHDRQKGSSLNSCSGKPPMCDQHFSIDLKLVGNNGKFEFISMIVFNNCNQLLKRDKVSKLLFTYSRTINCFWLSVLFQWTRFPNVSHKHRLCLIHINRHLTSSNFLYIETLIDVQFQNYLTENEAKIVAEEKIHTHFFAQYARLGILEGKTSKWTNFRYYCGFQYFVWAI